VALFLRDEDIRQTVSMGDMLEAIEDMQHHYGHGKAYSLGRRKIIASSGLLSVMGGGLYYNRECATGVGQREGGTTQGVFGVKTYTVIAGKYSFHITLYDTATGELLAFLQANRLGQLRTGATTGVATRHLARENAGTVGIIGTGYQALTQLEAISRVRQLSVIKAYSRTPERRKRFAQDATRSLGIEVVAAESNREAVEDSDVVVCITNAMEPVLDGNWLAPGALLVSAGPTTWRAREVDDASIRRASRIVVDSLDQAPIEAGELASAVDRGLIQWSQLVELRHIVSGLAVGRQSQEENIYAKLMGTGVADMAAAKLAYDLAQKKGVGTEIAF